MEGYDVTTLTKSRWPIAYQHDSNVDKHNMLYPDPKTKHHRNPQEHVPALWTYSKSKKQRSQISKIIVSGLHSMNCLKR